MKKSMILLAFALVSTSALSEATLPRSESALSQKPALLSDAELDNITAGGLVSVAGGTLITIVNPGHASIDKRVLPNGKTLCINNCFPPPPPPPH